MTKEPIYQGILQSDLDCAGFDLLNFSGSGTGGGGGDITQLVDGQGYIEVTFDETQPDANWTFTQLLVANTVDATPLNLWPGTLTSKSATGFTLQLSGDPDSSNYYLHWGFTGTGGEGGGGSSGLTPLPASATASELLSSSPMTRTPIAALAPSTGNFFDSQSFDPCIIVNPSDSSQLIMFFSGMGAPVMFGEQKIGRATASITAPSVWTVSNSGNPVLSAALAWETGGDGLRSDSVIYNSADSKIYLFYTAKAGSGGIGLATSTDLGLTWTKLGQVLTPSGSETAVSQFAVIMEGTTLHGLYAYRDGSGTLSGYRYASASTSNWTSWTKSGPNIYTDATRYNEFHHFFKVGTKYILAFETGSPSVPFEIWMLSSDSPNTGWSLSTNTPFVVKSGVVSTFDRYHVATPHVRVINGYWYMIYCGALDHDQPYGTNRFQMGIVPLGS